MNKDYNLYLKSAKYYDYDNRDNLTADIPFYQEYATKLGGDILELGCGTGRVTIPLAELGSNVTGLDLSESMLNIFNEKLLDQTEEIRSRINLVKGDMKDFRFKKRFHLIIVPFRAFQSLTEEEDINRCLKCVYEHLSENGFFIINAFRPYKILDETWCYPETIQWETVDKETGFKLTKKHWGSKIDLAKQIIYPNFAYELSDKVEILERIEEELALRYYYYQELKDYLILNGFNVVEEYGWYDKSDINNGRELIFLCRKRGLLSE